jgi:hypothetical protein
MEENMDKTPVDDSERHMLGELDTEGLNVDQLQALYEVETDEKKKEELARQIREKTTEIE